MSAQRRENVRAGAGVPVRVVRDDAPPIASWALDLSGGGFRLAGPDVLVAGEEFAFTLSLPGGRVEGRARVVHADRSEGIGCEFSDLSYAQREAIVRFVFVRQRQDIRDLDTGA